MVLSVNSLNIIQQLKLHSYFRFIAIKEHIIIKKKNHAQLKC